MFMGLCGLSGADEVAVAQFQTCNWARLGAGVGLRPFVAWGRWRVARE